MSFSKIKPLLFVNKTNVTILRNITETALKSWKEIPGPTTLPFIGQMLHFLPVIGSIGPTEDFSKVSDFLYKKYGPIVRLEGGFGSPPFIFIFDVEMIEQILRSENTRMPERPGFPSLEYYRKEYSNYKFNERSSGLLTEHGEKWKSFRSAVNPVMLQPKTIRLYSDEIDNVALDVIKRLKSLRNEKNMIAGDFELELNKWGLESVGVVALGGRIGCIDGDLPEDSLARQLIQTVREAFAMSDKLDNKPALWRYIPTKDFKKAMKIYENQIELTRTFIKNAIEQYKKRDKLPENRGVLEKLLEVDEDIAVVMASDMLFAGVDTTAHTMLGLFYLLGVNPEKQAKLRKELQTTTAQDKRPYLKACIKEGMRLMPVASANMRRTTKDYNLNGYLLPEKTNVGLMHEYVSKMDCHFPRPQEYVPERWIADKNDELYYGKAHPMAYNPFGFGVRMCIGRRIAELEIETFLSRFIENFDVEWFGPPPERKSNPLSYVIGPYNFILNDVKKD